MNYDSFCWIYQTKVRLYLIRIEQTKGRPTAIITKTFKGLDQRNIVVKHLLVLEVPTVLLDMFGFSARHIVAAIFYNSEKGMLYNSGSQTVCRGIQIFKMATGFPRVEKETVLF